LHSTAFLSTLTQRIVVYAFGLLLLRLAVQVTDSFRTREWLFLIASYLFYLTWGSWFLAILVFSSLVNYGLAIYLRRRVSPGRLWIGIGFNLLLLGFFKYLPLVAGVSANSPELARLSHIILPVGISFWTFQAISYLLDLYREEDLNPSLLEFCLYMAFWPTVLSGPICRLPNMLPQFRQPTALSWQDIGNGTLRILTGILMMAVSQIVAVGPAPGQGVDAGFAQDAGLLGGTDVWCLAIGYGFQLFFNFAGYSHIVIGAAQLFSIRLQENFNRPYLSTTPSVFWTRWHMSLSFWIRDYVFFPFATLRKEIWWRNLSLVFAMFVFGLWHKGDLLYMVWGIYHGLLLVLHRQWQQLQYQWNFQLPKQLLTPLSWLVTFGAVSLGWILFRAESKEQAATMFRTILSPSSYSHGALSSNFYGLCLLAMLGYFAVVGIATFLDRQILSKQAAASVSGVAGSERAPRGVFAALARDRWVWTIPIVLVLTLYALLILHPQGPLVGPMMYQIF
jgi:alginate O-acetyltransferase complex protein AlgI